MKQWCTMYVFLYSYGMFILNQGPGTMSTIQRMWTVSCHDTKFVATGGTGVSYRQPTSDDNKRTCNIIFTICLSFGPCKILHKWPLEKGKTSERPHESIIYLVWWTIGVPRYHLGNKILKAVLGFLDPLFNRSGCSHAEIFSHDPFVIPFLTSRPVF